MSILSLDFLVLAAGTLLVYYLLPLKIRWIALLAGSAAFVCLSGWQCAAHLSAAALVMWGGGMLLGRKKSRLLLAALLVLDLGAMVFLKYYPPLVGAEWILPVGLSYFTFQSAGYLIDVFRGKTEPQRNPLKAWLFRIATNEALRLLGRDKNATMLSLDDVTADMLSTKADAYCDSGDEIAARLQKAILHLPAKQQLAFNLRYYDELSYEEIAEVAGSSASSAKTNYHLAKEKIIDYMNKND